MSTRRTKPDLDDLPYSADKLEKLWGQIKDILAEQGGLCGDELADALEERDTPYRTQTIRRDILPKMREPLRKQGFISVHPVPGKDEKIMKKEWTLE